MQKIAAEMNLSETAFVKKINGVFSLRWFTPLVEVELCGHATLASAHILWQEEILSEEDEVVFQTVYKGTLTASKDDETISVNLPANVPVPENETSEIEKALNVVPEKVYSTKDHYLVELKSEDEVRKLIPDFNLIGRLSKFGIIITAISKTSGYDFVSRFFAPSKGVNEDPVTGSAHCVLAPYWSSKLGKTIMSAYQASERGGSMTVEIMNDRILLRGKAVTVLEGKIFV